MVKENELGAVSGFALYHFDQERERRAMDQLIQRRPQRGSDGKNCGWITQAVQHARWYARGFTELYCGVIVALLLVVASFSGIKFGMKQRAGNLVANPTFQVNGKPSLISWVTDTVLTKIVNDAPIGEKP
ncbi:MAG: hypothetical protein M1469_07105 [Bacteroidetes bacterium]|nr:hypothetical protein [Bacteroidota bacterium]